MRLGLPRLPAVLALALLAFGAGAARADESADALRDELLRGRTTGDWNGTLKAVLERPAEVVGQVLGPLFTTPEHAARTDLLAAVSAYLASHPVALGTQRRVLLAEYVLRRAHGDPAFVERLREPLIVDRATGRRPDWDLLLDHALLLARDETLGAADRAAGLAFAAQEDGARAGDVVDALTAVAARLREESTTSAADREQVTVALLDAFDELLACRFASLDSALPELERTLGRPYVKRLKHFSSLKSGADRDRALAVLHGREVVRAMESPADLARALEGGAFPYAELQRAVLERAAVLKPRPGAAWEDVFRAAVDRALEPDIVLRTLDLLAESGFGGGPRECCGRVAESVQRRLTRTQPRDPPEVRRRLVVALGDLAALEPVARQVSDVLARRALAAADLPEVVELIRAAGRCPGVQVDVLLRPFYELASFPALGTTERELLREQVARALGRDGVRAADPLGAVNALLGMLDGGGEWDRAASPKVREQAYRSLASYPSDAVITRLLTGAQASEPPPGEESHRALEALGQMLGAGDESARAGARALVLFLRGTRERSDADARRLTALKRLKDLPPGEVIPAELRAQVQAAVRELLESPVVDVLRIQAARTAAELADADALAPLIAWWAEQPQAPRAELLQALFDAVVRAGPLGDARVAAGLLAVSATPGQTTQAVEWADALAKSALRDPAPRPALLSAQAATMVARADTWATDPAGESRRAEDLEGARTILNGVVRDSRGENVEPARRTLVAVLERLAAGLGASLEGVERRVEAVARAADSKDADTLRAGERLARELLGDTALRSLLSPAEQAELERQASAIRASLDGVN